MKRILLVVGILALSLMITACSVEPEPVPTNKDSSFYDCIDLCKELKGEDFIEDNMEICKTEIYENYYNHFEYEDRQDIRRECTIDDDDEDAPKGAEKLDFDCVTPFCENEVEKKLAEFCFDEC